MPDDMWFSTTRKNPDGSRKKLKTYGDPKRWRARWTDPLGKTATLRFEKQTDAIKYENAMKADVSRGRYVDPRGGKVTFREYAEQWRADAMHRESTQATIERMLRLHIYPLLGDRPIARIMPSTLKAWMKDRLGVLKISSFNLAFSYVWQIMDAAVVDELRAENPCRHVDVPFADKEKKFVPTAKQVHQIAAALPERYRAMVYLAAGCGARFSEAAATEAGDHLNFLGREITIDQQLVKSPGQPPYLGPPKTQSSIRTVDMAQITASALAWHLEHIGTTPVEIVDRTGPEPVTRTAELLFTTTTGRPLTSGRFSDIWLAAVAQVPGLPKGFSLHGLRHYAATSLIHGGADVKTVQLFMGHASPRITFKTYIHEWPMSTDKVRTLMDQVLGTTWELPGDEPGDDTAAAG